MAYKRQKRNLNKPLHPEQFRYYHFGVYKDSISNILQHGVPAGSYGSESPRELKSYLNAGNKVVRAIVPHGWIDNDYGTDTKTIYQIPPSFLEEIKLRKQDEA